MRRLAWCLLAMGCDGGTPFVAVDANVDTSVLDAAIDAAWVAPDAERGDAIVQNDAANDGATALDASASLEGTWRLVSFETSAAGASLHLTDTNRTVYVLGVGNVPGRCNGWLTLRSARASLASCLLFDDHVYPTPAAADFRTAFQVYGSTVPGTLEDSAFRLSGAATPYVYTRNADGTISYVDAFGNHSTWRRSQPPQALTAVLTMGQATLFDAQNSDAFAHARVALVWDRAGVAVTSTQDSSLNFFGAYARFPIAISALPSDARVQVGNLDVALAYLVVYDDINNNQRYESADVLRGLSPIAIAYRGAGVPNQTFANSQFQDLYEGFQFVHLHTDYAAAGAIGLAPLDHTLPISPDVLVNSEVDPSPIPNLLQ